LSAVCLAAVGPGGLTGRMTTRASNEGLALGPSGARRKVPRSVRRGSGAGRALRRVPGSRRRSGCARLVGDDVVGEQGSQRIGVVHGLEGAGPRVPTRPGAQLRGPPKPPPQPSSSITEGERATLTGRSGKVRRSGVAEWVPSCQILLVPTRRAERFWPPRTNRRAERPPTPRES
jgi:hypothetical protein